MSHRRDEIDQLKMESIQELLKKSTDPVVDQSIFKNFGDGEV
jgi:hypothetical protein